MTLDLKQLEIQRKKYKDDLDNLKKLEGEEKGILAEKDRIDKMIVDAGYSDAPAVKEAITKMETEITELTAKINTKIA